MFMAVRKNGDVFMKPPETVDIGPATNPFSVRQIDSISRIMNVLNISQIFSFQEISPFKQRQ